MNVFPFVPEIFCSEKYMHWFITSEHVAIHTLDIRLKANRPYGVKIIHLHHTAPGQSDLSWNEALDFFEDVFLLLIKSASQYFRLALLII